MRQGERWAAALLSAEPRWPRGWIEVLLQAEAQGKTIPCCAGRVLWHADAQPSCVA